MAGIADIFGGAGGGMFGGGGAFDPGGLYAGLLTPQQQQALAYRGLMAAAAALGQAGMPSRMPVPLGAALGQAAGAMGTAQDQGAELALKGQLYGAQGQQLKAKADLMRQYAGDRPPGMFAPGDASGQALGGFLGGMQKSGALDYTAPFISGRVPAGFAAGLAGGMAGMGQAQEQALRGQVYGAQAQHARAKTNLMNQYANDQPPGMFGPGGPAGSAAPSGMFGPSAPATASTIGGSPGDLVKKYESGGNYNVGYSGVDLSGAPLNEYGFPIWEGKTFVDKDGKLKRTHAAGAYQFQPATWAQYAGPLGIKDFSQESQDAVFQAAYADQGMKPWAPYNPKLAAALKAGESATPGVLPGVPNFTGMFGGNQGAAYAPIAALAPGGGPIQSFAQQQQAAPTPVFGLHGAPKRAGEPWGALAPTPVVPGSMSPGMSLGGVNPAYTAWAQRRANLGSLLGVPTPGYINDAASLPLAGPKAQAEALARVGPAYMMPDANPELQGRIAGAREGGKAPWDTLARSLQAQLDRDTKRLEQERGASLDPTTIIETLPNGQRVERQVTRRQYADMVSGQGAQPATPGQQGGLQPGGAMYGKPYQTPAEAEFGQAVGRDNAKEFFARRTMAQDAATSLESSSEARKLLDSGVITGTGATYLTNLGKALRTFGFNAHFNDVPNTEAFAATRAQEVGRIIKLFGSGTGLSNADREYAERAAAGQITLDEQSIRRILDINDRASRTIIQKFNLDAERVPSGLSPYPLTVQPPGPAGGKSGVTSSGVRWSLQ